MVATFDPRTDPFINRHPPMDRRRLRTTAEDASNYGKAVAGSILGLPMDVANLIFRDAPRAVASPFIDLFGGKRPPELPPYMERVGTSENIAKLLQADMESAATQAGLFGVPSIEDVAKKGIMKLTQAVDPSVLQAMTLFHGTPHKFDKFELSKIGTGEGAQAFGHGLYFAENPGVAKSYQSGLSSQSVMLDGEQVGDFLHGSLRGGRTAQDEAINAYSFAQGDFDEAKSLLLEQAKNSQQASAINDAKQAIDWLESNKSRLSVGNQGHLYEVEIPDEVTDKMLDWDAPLSEQPEIWGKLKQLVLRLEVEGVIPADSHLSTTIFNGSYTDYRGGGHSRKLTGADAYKRISQNLSPDHIPATGKEGASRALNQAGIPGIRFWDGGSRRAGNGTRNIVVFNPDDIVEVKRDGELVFKAGNK